MRRSLRAATSAYVPLVSGGPSAWLLSIVSVAGVSHVHGEYSVSLLVFTYCRVGAINRAPFPISTAAVVRGGGMQSLLVLVQEEWEVMDGDLSHSLHRPSVGERGVTSFMVSARRTDRRSVCLFVCLWVCTH